MSQLNITTGGGIQIKRTARGVQFWAHNHERGQSIHIGTLIGSVYEKGGVAILQLPEPSITLTQAELGAAREAGAEYLRFLTREKITYSISLADFERHAQPYFNAKYGPQWRVALGRFVSAGRTARRNSITDNPRTGDGDPMEYHRPQPRQLDLFRPAPAFDAAGNFRGGG